MCCISVLSVVISPFSFLILFVWFFSLFSCWLWLIVCLFYLSSQEPAFSFADFCYSLLCFFFIYFCPNFMISFLLVTLGFFISSFSSCFRCRVKLFIWFLSCFLRYICTAMKLPLSTAFTESHQFWVVVFSFSFFPMHIFISFLISSVICWLFRSVLFSFHVFVFLTACFL